MLAISCYVAGIVPPLPVQRLGNACTLMLKGGMPYADICKTPSNDFARYSGVGRRGCRDHDALDDALSVAAALQHLLRGRALVAEDLF